MILPYLAFFMLEYTIGATTFNVFTQLILVF